MTRSGGAAALYGFLFQILRMVEWALRIDLASPDRTAEHVTLVAEPPGSDQTTQFPHERVAQQFKTRGARPWSLAEIVVDVLPDLYRAIPDDDRAVRYEFVTNGNMGGWAPAYEFFRSLASRTPGPSPLAALDATALRFQFRGYTYSERGLFDAIATELRKHAPAKSEELAVVHRKLWHLLARFEFIGTGGVADARAQVRRLLAQYVLDDDALPDKASRLLDVVLGYAAEGIARSRRPNCCATRASRVSRSASCRSCATRHGTWRSPICGGSSGTIRRSPFGPRKRGPVSASPFCPAKAGKENRGISPTSRSPRLNRRRRRSSRSCVRRATYTRTWARASIASSATRSGTTRPRRSNKS